MSAMPVPVVKPRSAPREAVVGATSAPEEVLEPDLEILDPHVHIFDDRRSSYPVEELCKDTADGHNITGVVFVECEWGWDADAADPLLAPVGEVRRVVEAQASARWLPGAGIDRIIGHADLRAGARAGDVLDALAEAGRGALTGIRHGTTWDPHPEVKNHRTDPPPGLLRSAQFRAGFAQLASRNLSFDAWCYHHQLAELADLARSAPGVPVVVDHLGGPLAVGRYASDARAVRARWRASMRKLQTLPNVHVKIGGLGFPLMIEPDALIRRRTKPTRARLLDEGLDPGTVPLTSWELADHWAEDVRWCIELFGVDRCMFESNFPVDRVTCSYRTLWNTFKRIALEASPSEKAALFAGTARTVYRVQAPDLAPLQTTF